jgi:hypothetical protein
MSEPDAPEDTEAKVAEPEAPAATTAEAAAPAKKKKKKKPEPEPEAEAEPPIDDPRVREIAVMFDTGDFVKTRALANELLASSDPRLVDVGRDYLVRTGVDPIQLAFLGLCAAVLIAIAWIYIPH